MQQDAFYMNHLRQEIRGSLSPGDDIVMTGSAGNFGAWKLLKENEAEARAYFRNQFVDKALEVLNPAQIQASINVNVEKTEALHSLITCAADIGRTGIFGALWKTAEASGAGLRIDVLRIPVNQYAVEICELFEQNLYRMDSAGDLLFGSNQGQMLVRLLAEQGVKATVIGYASEGRERLICNRDRIRYLERP